LSRLQIVRHHRDLGLVMSPLLLVLFLTGSMLVFRPIADVLFAPLSPAGTITASLEQPKGKAGRLSESFDWHGLLQSVRDTYPEGQLRGISVPRREGQLIRVRVKQPGEWLPNGRSMLWFDPATGRLVDSRDAMTLPLATRAYNAVFPIHASKIGGAIYKVIMTFTGLTLTMLGSLAVYAFWSFKTRRERPAAAAAERIAG
ncbi:MAG TPA: PepSY-associated TM helix domain-containing protein, partial [Polyangiales bacterium]|nr:PepSY-associated TM helix domain-containing protein [Polyangiales bacterium]